MSQLHDTDTPSRTSWAAATRLAGETWFSVPSRSSSPQRPQFDSWSNHVSTSSSDGVVGILAPFPTCSAPSCPPPPCWDGPSGDGRSERREPLLTADQWSKGIAGAL